MWYNYRMIIRDESEMLMLGEKIGRELKSEITSGKSIVIEMIGDVGTGKTTLTRGMARGLGVKEAVTSPSFTLSKRYEFPGGSLIHYDFYRLDEPGILVETLEETISEPGAVTVIEWGESVKGILPEKHKVIEISYNEDGTREVKILRLKNL